MNEIIDVNEYTEIKEIQYMTTEELTSEVNTIYTQIETIGQMGCVMMAQAGKRLNEIKERIPHGEWENWMKENLKFSASKARYMMKYATKAELPDSIFSNPQSIGDLGTARLFALLDAPEEVAKEVIEKTKIEDVSVKELKEEIQNLKRENEELAPYKKKVSELEANISELTVRAEQAEAEAEKNSNEEELADALDDIQAELENAKQELENAKQELKTAKANLAEEKRLTQQKVEAAEKKITENIADIKEKAAEEAKAKALEEAEEQFAKDSESLYADLESKDAEIERLNKKLSAQSNEDLLAFKLYTTELQKTFGDIVGKIESVEATDEEQAQKMREALTKLLTKLKESLT